MNEYAKKLLPKVSPWKSLFKKELIKCIDWAEPQDLFELRNWCYDNFYDLYPNILAEVFGNYKRLQRPVDITKDFGIRLEFQYRKLTV